MADGRIWTGLQLVCFNRGNRARFEDILGLINRPSFDVLALSEMSSVQEIVQRFVAHPRYGVIQFPGVPGASGNPIVYNKERMRLEAADHHFLLPEAVRAGTHNQQKNLIIGRFTHLPSEQIVWVGSFHNIQHQDEGNRGAVAREAVQRIVQFVDGMERPVFLGGD